MNINFKTNRGSLFRVWRVQKEFHGCSSLKILKLILNFWLRHIILLLFCLLNVLSCEDVKRGAIKFLRCKPAIWLFPPLSSSLLFLTFFSPLFLFPFLSSSLLFQFPFLFHSPSFTSSSLLFPFPPLSSFTLLLLLPLPSSFLFPYHSFFSPFLIL